MNLEELFCDVDDFCQVFLPQWHQSLLANQTRKRLRSAQMSESEIMCIVIHFHQSGYRHFKHYYLNYIHRYYHAAFPGLLSYSRFIEKMANTVVPLCAYLTHRYGKPTQISYIDSTSIAVCHNLRIPRHLVFKHVAKRGKTSTGWFYGLKLHLVINHLGEILAVAISAGNTDDRKPVSQLVKHLTGTLYADKGYLSKTLSDQLAQQDLRLITTIRKNMKPQLMNLWDRLMLRKRFIIETIFDQLKNISQIEHSRHRNIKNFMVNLIAGLIAYTHQPQKPAINITELQINALTQPNRA